MRFVLASATLVLAPLLAAAQPHAAHCAPLPSFRGATFTFGNDGGNLRPGITEIWADGRVTRDSTVVTRVAPARVASLARLARTGGFWRLRSARITRPPSNPDAARRAVTVRLTCGTHRAEYAGTAPAAFEALFAKLGAVGGS